MSFSQFFFDQILLKKWLTVYSQYYYICTDKLLCVFLILKTVFQAVDEILENQKPILHKLAEETKALEKNVSPDVEELYKQEFDDVQGKWNRLKVKVSKDLHLLEEITPKLRTFEVNLKVFRSLSLLQSKIVTISN